MRGMGQAGKEDRAVRTEFSVDLEIPSSVSLGKSAENCQLPTFLALKIDFSSKDATIAILREEVSIHHIKTCYVNLCQPLTLAYATRKGTITRDLIRVAEANSPPFLTRL
jgi:hypothetical protein